MIIVLQIFITIISFFFAVFLEMFTLSLLGFHFLLPIFLLARKRVDWKILLLLVTVISLILDVVLHYRLGTNLLLFAIPFAIFLLFSFLFSVDEEGIPMYVTTFLASLGYYVAFNLVPSIFTTGAWGFIDTKIFFLIVLKTIITTVLVWLGELLIYRFRDRGNSKQIRLK
ncbi:MAG: hypothetical protein ACOX0R_03235 [Candidatus Dojkabacteria bacterium]|jgi:hypothetical protein